MATIHQQITEWKNGLLAPNQNDVLLVLSEGKNAQNIDNLYKEDEPFLVEFSSFLEKTYKSHQNSIKETGAPIFGIAKDKFKFEWNGFLYEMPFLMASADIHKNQFNKSFKIQQNEDFYINPLLENLLGNEELSTDIDETTKILKEAGLSLEVEQGIWVANLHPHRFVLQKEFDELLACAEYSETLKSLFGEEHQFTPIYLADEYIFPADVSQRKAISLIPEKNLVIQGPPGTGKSQVIANVIGKTIAHDQNVLLVTEKAVALQVIYDQLKQKELHHFCVLHHQGLKAKHFVNSIKNTWEFLEKLPKESSILSTQSYFLKQGLDLTLERLQQKDLIGGIRFYDFKRNFSFDESIEYLSIKPDIPTWQKDKLILQSLEEQKFPIFGAWTSLKLENHELKEVEKRIKNTLSSLKKLPNPNITWEGLKQEMKLSGLVSLFYFDDKALPIELFEEKSKLQNRFLKLYRNYKTLLEKEALLVEEKKHWSKEFSLSELNDFIEVLTTVNKFTIRYQTTKNKLSKFTDLDFSAGKKALENLRELKDIQSKIVDVRDTLRKLNLSEDLPVLDYINLTIDKIQSTDENSIKSLFKISDKERLKLKDSAKTHNNIHQDLRYYFNLKEQVPILEQLEKLRKGFPKIVEHQANLRQISRDSLSVLQNSLSISEADSLIFNSHWRDFKGRFPALAEVDSENIRLKVEEIIQAERLESERFASAIQQTIRLKFDAYHQLLQTPTRKLSEGDKILKQELKKGKSILVKAFDRKRVYPSVRELMESEAKHWIKVLLPVVLGSPYSIAKSIPLDFKFDLAFFDEASQIPLSHIVGSVQRAKRVVISGDQQQMAPQFYFQRKEIQQSDALHHASFYWENAMLTHHYRAKYPELIAFSNRYFYENQLKTFPTFGQAKNAIELVTLAGIYQDRTNEKEADFIANLLTNKIKNKEFNFGLVAFSQAQLDAIVSKIPSSLLAELENLDSIFIQSLENVQGDQCEHLIISLGYAKNEDGDFHKRFGPLNQEQGHRRLNVLMSRAKSQLTFVRSVTSSDFSISDNEGVEMLRKLMLFLEENEKSNEILTHFSGYTTQGNKFLISDFSSHFKNAQELIDFYLISKNRGWEIVGEGR